MAEDDHGGLWGAQERARKALVHASKVKERAKRALPVAAARERSAARHDRHAETLEAHGAKRAAAAERRDAQSDRDAAGAERERLRRAATERQARPPGVPVGLSRFTDEERRPHAPTGA